MRRHIASISVAAAITGGAAAGALLGVPSISGAQTTTTEPAQESAPETREERKHGPLDEALAALVEDGTLTRAQADAVRAAVQERMPEHRARHGHKHGLRGVIAHNLDVAAEALNLSRAELVERLRDGRTLAEVAGEQGVAVDTLVDALVAEAERALSEAVEAGRISEERAAEVRETMRERITTGVNEGFRMKLRGPGHRFGDRAPAEEPADGDAATASA